MTPCLPDMSVVIPAYRAESTISRAIASVLAQADVQVEVIVVVDASPDHTVVATRQFAGVTVLVNDVNRGAPASRNRGLAAARAPFVMFLDADDYVEGPLLRSLLTALHDGQADLALGTWAAEWPDGCRRQHAPPHVGGLALIAEWLEGAYVPPCAVGWRRTFLQAIGGWDETLKKNDDGDVIFRGVQAGGQVAVCEAGLGVYYQHVSEHRISTQTTLDTLASCSRVLERVLATAGLAPGDGQGPPATALAALQSAVAKQYYVCAADAFQSGLGEAGARYLSASRALGFHGHTGSPLRRLLASVLGLRGLKAASTTLRRVSSH